MDFNLERDVCFFDLEATGLNVIRDRIMQIGIIKYFKNGKEPEKLDMLINPGIPIGMEAMSVHGITPKDVANKPVFAQVAQKLYDFIGNSDLGGYNISRFDVPLLMEEFARAGFDFKIDKRNILDMQRIFYKMEPRTLSAAVKFYTGKKMENAHNALADVEATVAVFKGQLKMYENTDYEDADGNIIEKPIKNDMKAIHEFTQDKRSIDVTNRLKYNDAGEVVFNFGKYTGQPVKEVLAKDKPYFHWILNKEFSVQVKTLVKQIMKEVES